MTFTVYPLRKLALTATIQQNYAATFKFLVSKLGDSNIDVEMEDAARGLVVARCLSLVTNWVFWRAWSDKLLFELKGIDPTKTEVKIYVIPNLLRYRVRKNDKALDRSVDKAPTWIARVASTRTMPGGRHRFYFAVPEPLVLCVVVSLLFAKRR